MTDDGVKNGFRSFWHDFIMVGSIIVTIVSVGALSGWWLNEKFSEQREIARQSNAAINVVRAKLLSLEKEFARASRNRWTRSHMVIWFSQCKWGQKTIVCPHPNSIRIPGLDNAP